MNHALLIVHVLHVIRIVTVTVFVRAHEDRVHRNQRLH